MGYSIGIRPRSAALAKAMLAFMKENYRSWPVVKDGKGDQYVSDPTDDLDYDRASGAIGLNYGPVAGWEREHAYAVTRWMALKVGKKKSVFSKDTVRPNRFDHPVPFMVYDGYDSWPLLVVSSKAELLAIPKSARWCAVDRLGMKAEPHREITNVMFDLRIDVQKVMEKAHEAAGPAPEGKGNEKHWAWVERRERALLRFCRGPFNKDRAVLAAEMSRLDGLWESRGLRA